MAQTPKTSTPNPSSPRRRVNREVHSRTFTLAQANKAVPYVQRVVTDLISANQRSAQLHSNVATSTPGPARNALQVELHATVTRLRELNAELKTVGAQLTDPGSGTLHFPTLHQGQPAYLFWTPGQSHISTFLDANHTNPQPVTNLIE